MNKLLQVYGKNTGAQEIVQTELTSAFPSLVEQFDMVNRIYEKFYDWLFPFVYTEDGGADMTWRANVRSWIAKNPKLAELEAHFAQGTLSGTFTENIDDTDDTTFTDNRATKQKTTFKGVDTTSSGALADEVANEFEQGKNTTENARIYSRTRTYADGRNWVQVMKDVQAAEEPVYTFINSFARLLVSPTWCKQDFCEVLPPSVEMSVEAESLPAGSTATAEIVNRGTPFNADWLLSMGIPQGEQGEKGNTGDTGNAALTYNNMYFSNVVPSASLQIIQEIGKFNRVPVVGDMCNFIVYYTGESPNTRPVYIVIGRCTGVDSSFATFKTVNYALIGGENGTDGQGKQLYAHSGRLEGGSSVVFNYYCICDEPTLFTEVDQLASYDFSLSGYHYEATSNYPLLQYERQGMSISCFFLKSDFTSMLMEVSFRDFYISDNVKEL